MSHDYVEIEHQVIRDRLNKLFTFTAISSDEKLNIGEKTSLKRKKKEETEQTTLYNFIKIILSLNNILFLRYIYHYYLNCFCGLF